MSAKVALLLDGGFVKEKLCEKNKHFPTTQEIVELCNSTMAHPRLAGKELFRIYYYDAPPLSGTAEHPISRQTVDFSKNVKAKQNISLLDTLELQPDFAVRRGAVIHTGWGLGSAALRDLTKKSRTITANDIVPKITQKGVDIRIGLDIASLAVKRIVDVLVLVTGDSDFVPAIKLARKEGLKVYLEALGHGVRRELKAHADLCL